MVSINKKVINGRIALAVYVDDLLITDKDETDILCVIELLKAQFEVKDLSEVRMVLGIRLKQYSQQMNFDQSKYSAVIPKQILEEASLLYIIPMRPDAVVRLADTGGEVLNEERRSWYLQAIGKLMHLCYTRPDIIFTLHKLAQL